MSPRRRPTAEEQAAARELYAPPVAAEPRPTFWQTMAHRVGSCDRETCPFCARDREKAE